MHMARDAYRRPSPSSSSDETAAVAYDAQSNDVAHYEPPLHLLSDLIAANSKFGAPSDSNEYDRHSNFYVNKRPDGSSTAEQRQKQQVRRQYRYSKRLRKLQKKTLLDSSSTADGRTTSSNAVQQQPAKDAVATIKPSAPVVTQVDTPISLQALFVNGPPRDQFIYGTFLSNHSHSPSRFDIRLEPSSERLATENVKARPTMPPRSMHLQQLLRQQQQQLHQFEAHTKERQIFPASKRASPNAVASYRSINGDSVLQGVGLEDDNDDDDMMDIRHGYGHHYGRHNQRVVPQTSYVHGIASQYMAHNSRSDDDYDLPQIGKRTIFLFRKIIVCNFF